MDRSSADGTPPADGTTSRRVLLRRGGAAVAGAVALAGCTEDVGEEFPTNERWSTAEVVPDLPVDQRKDVLEAGIEELSDAAIEDVEGFVATLEERDLTFESVEEVADQLSLEYVEADPRRNGTFEVAGLVAGAYAALVDAGFEARGLELVFFETDGTTIGVAEVSTEWAVAFNEGEFSAGAYGEHVAGTIESRRDPPEPDVAPDE